MIVEVRDYINYCNQNNETVSCDTIYKIENYIANYNKYKIEYERAKEKLESAQCPHPMKRYDPSGKTSCHFCQLCDEEI